jgi:hypothetical protein
MNKLVAVAFGVLAFAVVGVLAHFLLPIPISEARGEWRIKDWYSHPDATPEQLHYYTDVRRQYPRTISIDSFWKGSIDSEANCSWTQSRSRMLETQDLPKVWVTTLTCEGRDPVRLVVRPFIKAIAPEAFWNFYSRANDTEISVLFPKSGGHALIEYVPADWQQETTE